MTDKLNNNYYSHLESDQSDKSTNITKKEKKCSTLSTGDCASAVHTSTYNTRSKGTTVGTNKNASSTTATQGNKVAVYR
jgi:hypothetical protein